MTTRPFEYFAADSSGKIVNGLLHAADAEAAKKDLSARNLRVLSLWEKTAVETASTIRGRVSPDDFVHFNTHLASITQSGLPMPEGLRALAADLRTGPWKAALEEVRAEIENGASLSDALRKRRDLFSDLYIGLVRAGEASGNLPGVLALVARHSQGLLELRRRITEALIYPTIVILAVVGIYVFESYCVIQNFGEVFKDMDLDIPVVTRLVLSMAQPEVVNTISVLIVGAIVFLWIVAERITAGRWLLDVLASGLPFVNTIRSSYAMSRFSATMSILLEAGVSVPDSLTVLITTIENPRLKRALAGALGGVNEGQPLSKALEWSEAPLKRARSDAGSSPEGERLPPSRGAFPATLTWMVSLGETHGNLARAFADVADLYEQRARRATAVLDSLLAPLVIVGIGLFILIIVVALFAPLVFLMEKIGV